MVGQARHRAALLVHRDEKRRAAGGLQIGVELRQLLRVGDVLAELADAAHRVGLQGLPHGVGQRGHTVGLCVVDRFLRKRQVKGVGADDEKLADFFFQRQRVGGGGRCGWGRGRCGGGQGVRRGCRTGGEGGEEQCGEKQAFHSGAPPFW